MKGYEGQEQIDIFNLDVAEPIKRKDKLPDVKKRKELAKERLYHTLKISNILESKCNGCEHNESTYTLDNCVNCPFYKQLREHGEALERTTDHKIHKEKWAASKEDRRDPYIERLYRYQTVAELESNIKPDEIAYLRESHSLVEIAQQIDCEYGLLKCYINKYNLNKRADGTYYDSVRKTKNK